MNKDLEIKLYNIDPLFFQEAIACLNGEMNEMNTCMYWGCECSDGWFKPLEEFTYKVKLLNELASKYNFYFICEQLKEKWGTLNIYWGTRILDKSKEYEETKEVISIKDLFRAALRQCEQKCEETCEWCGAEQRYNKVEIVQTTGWIHFVCDECSRQNIDFKNKDSNVISDFRQGYYYLNPFDNKKTFDYNGKSYNNIFGAYLDSISLLTDADKLKNKIINNVDISYLYIKNELTIQDKTFDYEKLEDIVYAKFSKLEKYKSVLLSTNDKALVFHNQYHDNDLGYCMCKNCENNIKLNHYGKILEKVRTKLKLINSIK